MSSYNELVRTLGRGWNTWDTRSVLSHVLLPEAIGMRLGIKEESDGYWLREALIGRKHLTGEQVIPGERSYDGSYTSCEVRWRGIYIRVETAAGPGLGPSGGGADPGAATDARDAVDWLTIVVTPLRMQRVPAVLTVEAGLLWNALGVTRFEDGALTVVPGAGSTAGPDVVTGSRPVTLHASGATHDASVSLATLSPYLALPLSAPIALSTGARTTVQAAERVVEAARQRHRSRRVIDVGEVGRSALEEAHEVYEAVQRVLAWDTIYDRTKKRVFSPVSRVWNTIWGGYVIFCWDTYFAAYIAGIENRGLAYANAVEITRAITDGGFVPNFSGGPIDSLDRSQPPVGSFIVGELYHRYGDRWLLEETFDALLAWNRWWPRERATALNGLLGWGSTPYEPRTDNELETMGVGDTEGGAYESGLDNSPMYDDVPFDAYRNTMALADVGLNSLYVFDCECLAEIADVLGRTSEANELSRRAAEYRTKMAILWNEERGIFVNRRSEGEQEFSTRISPTSFYPLLAGVATPEQAHRTVDEHLLNPTEFAGPWMIPSSPRNDPAYREQDYWRGRVWAPMNFLVYLGLRRYNMQSAMKEVAEASKKLLLKEWREHGHIHENYSAETGEGCDTGRSDRYYHWGGLLGVIYLMHQGALPAPAALAGRARGVAHD